LEHYKVLFCEMFLAIFQLITILFVYNDETSAFSEHQMLFLGWVEILLFSMVVVLNVIISFI